MAMIGRFSSKTVETLAKRAGMLCSNPDCGALTAGPSDDAKEAINIGEAAHIFGLTVESARYDPRLSQAELADITNGIWLCRNCHKAVDDDDKKHPSDLLFAWRRSHELSVSKRLGRQADVAEAVNARRLRAFEGTSYLAQQIVLDRPPYWEYKLTIELLRSELGVVQQKWHELTNGLYVRRTVPLDVDQIGTWFQARTDDLQLIVAAISKLIDEELTLSWGPPGQAGSDTAILRTCRLIAAAGMNLLEWEEELHFTRFPPAFQEVKDLWTGLVGAQIAELMRIPAELSKIFEAATPSGTHHIMLHFKLPDGFVEQNERAWRRSARRFAGKDPDVDLAEIWWRLRQWSRGKGSVLPT